MIFVLRKKQNQITFLHVYHHCAVIVFPTWAFHVVPGECSSFSKTVYIYHQTLIVIPFRWNGQFDCRSQLRRPRSYVQLLLPDDLQWRNTNQIRKLEAESDESPVGKPNLWIIKLEEKNQITDNTVITYLGSICPDCGPVHAIHSGHLWLSQGNGSAGRVDQRIVPGYVFEFLSADIYAKENHPEIVNWWRQLNCFLVKQNQKLKYYV